MQNLSKQQGQLQLGKQYIAANPFQISDKNLLFEISAFWIFWYRKHHYATLCNIS